ncbi:MULTISPECIES: hypothetical protein [unclassified Streptomyces]|uniref:hypothetical protein n=1 Tax=unclassified Streptomyces TaxID=2593676 RepID=UPI002366558D|nr:MULTISPECIES: hypothetical protein [unclassified Streptomyces]MDF3141059.1 hypothetical protein [Streptomyces sp. T21Q-yed]WDF45044.1 hypothetical protein PBV52_51000 [Streptomyces sp. T12]
MAGAIRPKRNTLRTRNQQNRLIGLVAASCAVLSLTACGGEKDDEAKGPTPQNSSSASRSQTPATDPKEAASRTLLADYRSYWDEKEKAYAKASPDGTKLDKYAVGTALASAKQDLKAMKSAGQIAQGKVTLSPKVRAMDLDRKVASATVRDCVDVSSWKLVDADTRKEIELPKERLTRYVSIVKAEKWGDRWVVLSATPENSKC